MRKVRKQKFFSAQELHEKWMRDPEYRSAYEALEPEFQLARAIIEARIKKKISQQELAKRAGTDQSVISRLEGMNAKPSLSLMKRVADALGLKTEIRFIPK